MPRWRPCLPWHFAFWTRRRGRQVVPGNVGTERLKGLFRRLVGQHRVLAVSRCSLRQFLDACPENRERLFDTVMKSRLVKEPVEFRADSLRSRELIPRAFDTPGQ